MRDCQGPAARASMGGMAIRGIVFDMDGTLLDTERLAHEVWAATEAETGTRYPAGFVYQLTGVAGHQTHRLAAEALGDAARSEAFFARYRENYQARLADGAIRLKPGAEAILHWAKAAGLRLGLATSTRRAVTDHKLAVTGLARFFSVTVCGDEVAASKPAPDIFLVAIERLGLPAGDLVALEDSPNGRSSATAAGLRTLLVPDLAPLTDDQRALAVAVCTDLIAARQWCVAQLDG